MSRPWLLVSGDFSPTGGMDRANHALARHLLGRGEEVHLVAHRASADLEGALFHSVKKPCGSYFLGEPLLERAGRAWARRLAPRGARVVTNGGNCRAEGAAWVHYVHAAWDPQLSARGARALKAAWHRRRALAWEARALRGARVLISNSERTSRDLVSRLGVSERRIRRVYLGVDAERFRPPSPAERSAARAALGWAEERRVALFVGGLGDRRKGFDLALRAWEGLARDPAWDVDLVHVGGGPERAAWVRRAEDAGLGARVRFLGFREDVPRLLQGADLLVAPTRYEPYGLGVHEAICCGLPAIVSAEAGVAERYPRELRPLLLADPEDSPRLVATLRDWRAEPAAWAARVARCAQAWRGRGWEQVSAEVRSVIEEAL